MIEGMEVIFVSEKELNKKELEQVAEQDFQNKFNSVTGKVKPENQNQQHNVKKEGIAPINQKR